MKVKCEYRTFLGKTKIKTDKIPDEHYKRMKKVAESQGYSFEEWVEVAKRQVHKERFIKVWFIYS